MSVVRERAPRDGIEREERETNEESKRTQRGKGCQKEGDRERDAEKIDDKSTDKRHSVFVQE